MPCVSNEGLTAEPTSVGFWEARVVNRLNEYEGEARALQSKLRSFWYLYRLRALPPETREYVAKVIAAMIIGRHPEQYGFQRGE